jgi:hypothetical protein
MLSLAASRRTQGMGALIVRCQQVNRLLGTTLGPWELEELPDEWLTALEMWVDEMPKAQAWQAESKAALERARNKARMQ